MKEIKLSQGKVALVDDEDYEYLMRWKWTASFGSRARKWYAIRRQDTGRRTCNGIQIRQRIAMHRVIMMCPVQMVVDHLNDNSLDNRKENLEIISQDENMRRVPGWKRKMEKPEL